ncbi:uncharacterized protein LOC133037102 [Cannabis sativa]|uniref:uncharacterized protein LOC133037102 n=1 Tax=Cannabis sativa TaxID=3483 RepID=UPI0029CA1A9F|nr:uncharacterized protein LOC133037102 [Cannabis sativa]
MKGLLDVVVSDTQIAFILGRLISDNITVSFEVMHYLKRERRGREGSMALKLDMSKAYNMVEWGHLHAILLQMGFTERWVDLILTCVTSVSYTIVHGGREMGPIFPTHGIRERDPFSLYLFIICVEDLFSFIRVYESWKWIIGIKVCSYIFCKAFPEDAIRVLELLHKFEEASSQQVNLEKSNVFFSANVAGPTQLDLCNILQMAEAFEHITYLGLPNTLGRSKSVSLGFLKDIIRKKVQD